MDAAAHQGEHGIEVELPFIAKLNPALTYRREDLERLARHVTNFSLAGIRAMAAEAGR